MSLKQNVVNFMEKFTSCNNSLIRYNLYEISGQMFQLVMYKVLFLIILQNTVSVLCKPPKETDVLDKQKQALRYGLHRTQECYSFDKAFMCIRKCLDKGFDVAYADKSCECTCFYKKEKSKYIQKGIASKWKGGAPTTKIPAWAQSATEPALLLLNKEEYEESIEHFSDGVTDSSLVRDVNADETSSAPADEAGFSAVTAVGVTGAVEDSTTKIKPNEPGLHMTGINCNGDNEKEADTDNGADTGVADADNEGGNTKK